jgi:hypothetical protein
MQSMYAAHRSETVLSLNGHGHSFLNLMSVHTARGGLTPSLPHWRECKLKPAPIFVLVD